MSNDSAIQQDQKTPARAWLILAVTYFASFMAPMAQFKLPPLASWLIPQFGLDGVAFGYLMSSLSIIGMIPAFPATFICRKFGLKQTMLVSIGSLAVGTAISVLGTGMEMLYIGRLIEGIGIGFMLAWVTGSSATMCMWAFIIIAGVASGLSGGVSRPMAPIVMGGSAQWDPCCISAVCRVR